VRVRPPAAGDDTTDPVRVSAPDATGRADAATDPAKVSDPAAGTDAAAAPASARDPAATALPFAVDEPPSDSDPDDTAGAAAPTDPPRDNEPDADAAWLDDCGASSRSSGIYSTVKTMIQPNDPTIVDVICFTVRPSFCRTVSSRTSLPSIIRLPYCWMRFVGNAIVAPFDPA
jgi:hypothetical protein